jgi:putative tricarboxylic transport membrane protein
MATISLLLPLTYTTGDATASIIFLAGIYYGSQYGGSITAILLKLPGEITSTVTTIDGYAMTQRGRGGAALTITAIASFIGGTVSTVIIAALALPLSEVAFLFGPAEYANLMLLGLLACVAISQGAAWKGLVMILLGGFLGLIGTDVMTGDTRFTADIIYLADGISFVVMAMGIFGLGEILYHVVRPSEGPSRPNTLSSLYPTRKEIRDSAPPIMRGTLLGTVLGLLPGGGAVLSSFLAYAVERRVNRNRDQIGRGDVAGVAAPEAANNAAAQSQFLPTLMLGLPITPIMALMLAVLIINGIQPGINAINNDPALFWGLIASMWIGNVMLLMLNIPLVRIWVAILHIPRWILFPAVILISAVGTYSLSHSWFDILLLAIFGVLGLLLRLARFEPAPLALAFVVMPLFEVQFNRALLLGRGDYAIFFQSTVSLTLMILAAGLILLGFFLKKTALQELETPRS